MSDPLNINAKPTLLCIPDISGFTKFMSDTDYELSAVVIPSLLNRIIYANTLHLQVSEIEGDAVFFYKTGSLPSFKDLILQCRKFYTEFYEEIKRLKIQYKDHEHVQKIPDILGLKIVVHYGKEIGSVQIGKNIKLLGEDVITAHRLLKNDISQDEYLLLSKDIMDQYDENTLERNFGWGELKDGDGKYKHIGIVNYSYIDLQPLID
ncbi:DUF2652 domain-containing protein [uncultured Dokdonia sp.]|uniref:DUF2652 domain-containing protein n=1 Tax=uncultured Dokdonia sp. TaxID=575653 RepID=UPI00262EAD2B|nr:DUF2652 domain-containing protein [uncultured Dokdonia sp.]